jgi:hypothetical protein
MLEMGATRIKQPTNQTEWFQRPFVDCVQAVILRGKVIRNLKII